MSRVQPRQEGGSESRESIMGDAVPHNGVEDQATRRDHMRAQTMARQAAERKAVRPSGTSRQDQITWKAEARERAADLHVELTRINAGHETWLREHGATDPLESEHPSPLPPDRQAPE